MTPDSLTQCSDCRQPLPLLDAYIYDHGFVCERCHGERVFQARPASPMLELMIDICRIHAEMLVPGSTKLSAKKYASVTEALNAGPVIDCHPRHRSFSGDY